MCLLRPLGGSNELETAAFSESPVARTPGETLDTLDREWWPNIFLIGVKSFLGEAIVAVSDPERVCGGVRLAACWETIGEFNGVVLEGRGGRGNSVDGSEVEESLRRWDLMSERMLRRRSGFS